MQIHQGFNAQLQLFLHDRRHLPPQDLITPFDFCHTAWPNQLANVGFLPEVKSCTGTAAFGRNLKDACIGCATVQKTGSEIKPSQDKYINGHIVKQSQREITLAGHTCNLSFFVRQHNFQNFKLYAEKYVNSLQ